MGRLGGEGFDASVRESQGSGGWGSRALRWQRLRRNRPEKAGTAPSSGAGLMPAPPPTLCCGRGAPFTIPPFRALPPKTLRTAAIVTCRPISLPLTHYALPGPLPLGGGCTSLQFSWLNDRRFPAMDFPLFHMAAPAKAHSCSTCRALSKATERFLPGIVDGPNKQIYQAFAGAKTW